MGGTGTFWAASEAEPIWTTMIKASAYSMHHPLYVQIVHALVQHLFSKMHQAPPSPANSVQSLSPFPSGGRPNSLASSPISPYPITPTSAAGSSKGKEKDNNHRRRTPTSPRYLRPPLPEALAPLGTGCLGIGAAGGLPSIPILPLLTITTESPEGTTTRLVGSLCSPTN